jgi:hypothetical protein
MEKKTQSRDIRALADQDPLADLPPLPRVDLSPQSSALGRAIGPAVEQEGHNLPPPPPPPPPPQGTLRDESRRDKPAVQTKTSVKHEKPVPLRDSLQRSAREVTAQPDPPTMAEQKLPSGGWRRTSNWILGISLFAVFNFGLGIALALFLWAGALDQYMDDIKAIALWAKQFFAK